MQVIVSLEHRFLRTPEGSVWSRTMFPYAFWQRYQEVFDNVLVVARAMDVPEVDGSWKAASGPGVSFHTVPYYHGLGQYLRRHGAVRAAIRAAYRPGAAYIMRIGSQIASCLMPVLRAHAHPFGVEVVGDPWEVFSPGAVRHPLRPLLRRWFARELRRQCRHAAAAAYVTEHALQRRYPPAPDAFSTHYSDVELPPEAIVREPRRPGRPDGPFRLVLIGSLDQMYKAPDVLIDAVARCRSRGLDLELSIVGDGRHRPELEQRAADHGLAQRVHFLGLVSAGRAVREVLDRSDLFVMPSRTEGLPRAMIEAMARGLPCIGSTVGGIPELLPPEDMVPPGDAEALSHRITEVLSSPEQMARMSERNLGKAREFDEQILRSRRNEFYSYIREKSAAFARHHRRQSAKPATSS